MKRSIVSIAALFAFATTAMAQVEQPSQISIQGTGIVTKDTVDGSNSQRSTKSGGLLVGYSYQFNRWAGVEGNYGFTRNTQNYFGSTGQASIRSDIHEVTGSFVAHIPAHIAKVRPYALAGAGALVFDPTGGPTVARVARQTKAAFVYGGGVDFDLGSNYGVRAEYRGLAFKLPDYSVNSLSIDKVTHIAQPSVGFFVRF